MIIDTIKIFLPAVIAFWIGLGLTPSVANFLYKNEMWKKKSGKIAYDGNEASVFNELHKEREVGTPRMGGMIIWLSAFITISAIWLTSRFFPTEITQKLDFLNRNQTWIPFTALMIGSLIGLIDDLLEVKNRTEGNGGLSLKVRIVIVIITSLLAGMWFFFKLDVSGLNIPYWGILNMGWLFIPFFAIVTLALYSGGVIDGIDGLAGGIFTIVFSAYAIIAFSLNQINLAAFCAMVAGATLAFLWFNIPPARFYMSETGTMGLTLSLAIVAFMTDTLGGGFGILVLPIIAAPLAITTLSNILQILSKKIRGKKIFLVAPIHHHFEAIGWPAHKVTMRFWVLGVIFAMTGVILALVWL